MYSPQQWWLSRQREPVNYKSLSSNTLTELVMNRDNNNILKSPVMGVHVVISDYFGKADTYIYL